MSQWPMVRLKELLDSVSRPEPVSPEVTYRILGAHWYAHGLYTKDTITGGEIQAPKVYRVAKGDFVYNRLFAWKGSFAVATDENDGCYVSNEFPCFLVKRDRLDAHFLKYYFSRESSWTEALGLSSGGTPTSRNRLKEEAFLQLQIPLPPLSEQRRLVERIDALVAKIEEAKNLFEQTEHGLLELCRSLMRSQEDGQIQLTPMKEIVRQREPDVSVQQDRTYHFAGIYCFGGGVFVGQRKTGMEFKYPRLTTLRTNNFVYPKLMAWEGALAVVPPNCDGLVVSTEYPVFEINQEKVLPEVLDVYFRTPSVWPALSGSSTGTNVRRRRLNPADFLQYKFPLPSKAAQEKLRLIKNKTDEAHASRELERKQLDAMLPAILDRAFRGEL
jgi:type I restriction enzyme S subunit